MDERIERMREIQNEIMDLLHEAKDLAQGLLRAGSVEMRRWDAYGWPQAVMAIHPGCEEGQRFLGSCQPSMDDVIFDMEDAIECEEPFDREASASSMGEEPFDREANDARVAAWKKKIK